MKTIKIASQEWTSENFNGTKFKNGDDIPQITDGIEWKKADYPAWCYYENNPENESCYGKLYNGFAIMDKRGIAPEGFRMPSIDDFKSLIQSIGGEDQGFRLKTKEKKIWKNNKDAKKGTDEFGFNAYPAGVRTSLWGQSPFVSKSEYTRFWSKTLKDEKTILAAQLGYGFDEMFTEGSIHSECSFNDGYSLRFLKD